MFIMIFSCSVYAYGETITFPSQLDEYNDDLQGLPLYAPYDWDVSDVYRRLWYITVKYKYKPIIYYLYDNYVTDEMSDPMEINEEALKSMLRDRPYYEVLEIVTQTSYEDLPALTGTEPDPAVLAVLSQQGDTPTDPEPTDPEPTDPDPTDPEPTDPEPTDPEPTDPEPTAPEPTVSNNDLSGSFSEGLTGVLYNVGTYVVHILPIALAIMGILVAVLFAIRFFRNMSR